MAEFAFSFTVGIRMVRMSRMSRIRIERIDRIFRDVIVFAEQSFDLHAG